MKTIGGYPELELRKDQHYHKNAIRLNTARNCLEYILLSRQYKKVYLPLYTCEAVLEPFAKLHLFNTQIEFYDINDRLDPLKYPQLNEGEAFLYTNYFGLKQDTVTKLVTLYGNRLIVDNSQAFFDFPHDGIDTFYSARKFFGVPDGAYLYTTANLEEYKGNEIETDYSFDRMSALLKRIDLGAEAGYCDFQKTEKLLSMQPIRKMSKLTEALLASIDYESVRKQRCHNYRRLYWKLFQKNGLWLKLNEGAVPLCYPFLAKDSSLRDKLIAEKVFIPTYWPNVLNFCSPNSTEYKYMTRLLPLPIGQTYGHQDMDDLALKINKYSLIL